jgi:hypothetical protein
MSDQESPPDWVEPLLGAGQPPARFHAACRLAGEQAAAVYQLRLARQRRGPWPVSVRAFLAELTRAAGVSLATVFEWAGPQLAGPSGTPFASAWGRLAAALRLDLREALLHLRLSLLEEAGLPSPVGLAARGPSASGSIALAEYEQEVEADTAAWDPARRAHLRECEQAARQAFTAAGV